MKIHTLISFFILASFLQVGNVFSQDIIEDTASMGPGNMNMVFYSLENGTTSTVDQSSWDIAFDVTSMMSTTIRVNGGMGSQLYLLGGLETWDSLGTVDVDTLEIYYNDQTNWGLGAYSQNGDNMFNVGWGVYDVVTHIINGDKVYILKLADGSLKKTKLVSLENDIYTFVYANLDGSEETEVLVDKNAYTNKNFVYYNFNSNEILDLEPENSEWDVVFCKYVENLGGGVYYPVTGALSNNNISVQKTEGLSDPYLNGTFDNDLMSTITNSIGYDWKSYNMDAGVYELANDRCYFVSTNNGSVWRLVFTLFGGNATGDIGMGIVLEQGSSIDENELVTTLENNVSVYPNPTLRGGDVTIDVDLTENYTVAIYNSLGAIVTPVMNLNNANKIIFNVSDLHSGFYIIDVTINSERVRKQLIIQ